MPPLTFGSLLTYDDDRRCSSADERQAHQGLQPDQHEWVFHVPETDLSPDELMAAMLRVHEDIQSLDLTELMTDPVPLPVARHKQAGRELELADIGDGWLDD